MPIYEYRCNSCGHELEKLQRISEAPLTDCPACSKAELRRLISPAGFRLKGSGWYETDFKSEKERKRNLAESASGDSGGKSVDGDGGKSGDSSDSKSQSDSKPASKTESKSSSGSGEKSQPAAEKKKSKGSGTEAA